MSATLPICARCGARLQPGLPGGSCLSCLLSFGLKEVTVTVEDQASVAASRPPEHDEFDRFRILEKIGEGGCGVVYRAEQLQPVRREVALKVIKLGMDTADVIARFEVERQALAMMDHPGIAKVFDAGTSRQGRPFFAMELVAGERITDFCDQRQLSIPQRLELFARVCEAVQHAHQKGIIHRDLKPSNILVTEHDGVEQPKVIDFGIAKATSRQRLTNQTIYTAFDQFIGTPAYMSPEQAGATGEDVDTRSDIYSLGVLLYELLTGRPPFEPERLRQAAVDEVFRIIRNEEPVKPSTRLTRIVAAVEDRQNTVRTPVEDLETAQAPDITKPGTNSRSPAGSTAHLPGVVRQAVQKRRELVRQVRGDLDWIVMKCLEKDRARRYETASSLAADLHRHLHHEPVLASPPSASYRAKKFIRKHRVGVAVAAGFAVLLTAAALLATALAIRADRARARAEQAEQTSTNVLGFFQKYVLSAARPRGSGSGVALGRDATVRGAIAVAEPAIEGLFARDPLTEASIRDALGTTYNFLGEYTDALRQHTRALDLWKSRPDAPPERVLSTLDNLAISHRKLGQTDRAAALFEEVLHARRGTLGPRHELTLLSMDNLAGAYGDVGRHKESLALKEEAWKLRQAILAPNDPWTLRSMTAVGGGYLLAGRTQEAIQLLEKALRLHYARLGTNHVLTAECANNLASAYMEARRFQEALPLRRAVYEFDLKELSPSHPTTLSSLRALARAYERVGQTNQALALRAQDRAGSSSVSNAPGPASAP